MTILSPSFSLLLLLSSPASAFVIDPSPAIKKDNVLRTYMTSSSTSAHPTIDELSEDPFMKQLSHASEIIPLLTSDFDERIAKLLEAQLSHADGIRGFFASYLTGEGETAADSAEVPPTLAEALRSTEDREDLISLACMNVIMPTAMTTMHSDPVLQQASAKTAERGTKVLEFLNTIAPIEVKTVCDAIAATAKGDDAFEDEEAMKYWTKFFSNYGYESQQKKDILDAISSIGS